MKLSIIILNYNVRHFLELCLKSVEAAVTDIEAEIIVVDNNSSDDSCQMIKSLFPDVLLIESKENTGFSRGNNIGTSHAKGEYICILNPDTVVAEDTFINLLRIADTYDELGIIGCRLIDGNGKFLQESKRNVPTPSISFKKMFGFSNSYYANHLQEDEIGEVYILVGAFMLLKRSIYNETSGFDEDYFMYGEDIDLSYKVIKKGLKNLYIGTETIIHFKGESTPKDIFYRKRFYDAMKIFYRKHFKKNFVLDLMISIGTKALPLLESIRTSFKDKGATKEEIIFDNNLLPFKEIIKSFERHEGSFKIRPKNSNFIIGSSGPGFKGEIRELS
ncbi:MAG: glycosyltransferase family 2 protein [Bacteroidia bacterium]|nr:glycosyltransferase family 2 protein [Bacteroidia bacterium]NND10511.1 glycosyltransferase family 2 protein [Flavobacteriaceae bacterium]MBT8310237.1 glycosyltransferase family 2 protein [Bacteroidia bacterium]NNK26808.1 glycosyltransferase family 2 protein [Flavobacteriaceae bacterium]NNL62008.1 glycosyltransferase family 2 protein [Flavobacteriaceae bacterium]